MAGRSLPEPTPFVPGFLGEDFGLDVAAAHDDDGFAEGAQLLGVEEQAGRGGGSAGLGREAGGVEEGAHGGADFGFGDGDDVVDVSADVSEVALAEGLGAEAVAEGAGGLFRGPGDERAGAEALLRVGGQLRLDADDARGGAGELDGGGDAAEESAAGDGREDEVAVGQVFENFEAAGALAGDDLLVVVGRDHDVTEFGFELFGFAFAIGAGRADFDDLRAHGRGGALFHFGRVARHDDDRFGTDGASGVGDSLGMIAAGIGDDAARALLGSQLGDLVVRAAQLEAADGLETFGFDVDFGVFDAGREEANQRRAGGDAADASLRIAKRGEGEQRGRGDGGHWVYCGLFCCELVWTWGVPPPGWGLWQVPEPMRFAGGLFWTVASY